MFTEAELERRLSKPGPPLIADLETLRGDIMILGIGGKMGPTVGMLARRAADASGAARKVYGVSRFSFSGVRERLEEGGVKTIAADLLDEEQLASLPEVENVIYMVGHKFGTQGQEHRTWTINTYLAGRIAERFKHSRLVVFSTGNVYPLVPATSGGATEDHPPQPVGEYAQSCLGRERIFAYGSRQHHTPILIFRLNYACELRYGVLVDIARAVWEGRAVDLTMGQVNVIWQGDACERALRALKHCQSPPMTVNITGPETISIRWVAEMFGRLLDREPVLSGREQDDALLSNASLSQELFGYPRIPLQTMLSWTAEWIRGGGQLYDKPTHFEERKGEF